MSILLQNGLIVTQNSQREILSGDILVEDNRIKKIDRNIPAEHHKCYDFTGLVMIPGLIQTHVHLCQTLFRNLAEDLELMEWLEERIWPWEMSHTRESLRISARLGIAEMMLSGTTGMLDMGNGRYQDVIFEEMINSGIRGLSGLVMMDSGDHPYKHTTGKVLDLTEELIERWHGSAEGRIQYALAPRFVPSCSKLLWDGVRNLTERHHLIVHTHSSENRREWELVKKQTGLSNIEFFKEMNLASPKLCLAHCIWVSENEIDILAKYKINVLHCPSSNLKLGSGIAPVAKFMNRNINVSLGSDGAPCNNNLNILQEMRLAGLLQKPMAGVRALPVQKIFDMATLGGATSLGLKQDIGSLEPGKKADLAVLDLNKVSCIPADDIYSQIVYSAQPANVKHVMVNGQWTVYNQKLINISEEEVCRDAWHHIQNILKPDKNHLSH